MKLISRFEIAKLELREGDTLVVKVADENKLSAAELEKIGEQFKPYVPEGVKFCVMTAGLTMHIIRKQP